MKSQDVFSIENELKFVVSHNQSNKKFKIPKEEKKCKEDFLISTGHNLNEKILRRIFVITGLKYKPVLETKKNYIDKKLLANRNSIAHGEPFLDDENDDFSLSFEEIKKLKKVIILILDSFKEELSDYVKNEYYLSHKQIERMNYEKEREEYLEKSFKEIEDE